MFNLPLHFKYINMTDRLKLMFVLGSKSQQVRPLSEELDFRLNIRSVGSRQQF